MKTTVAGIVAGAVLVAAPAMGQEVKFGGQVRHRFEYRDPAAGNRWDSFTSMRVRANLTATLARQVTAFVQVQDVRIWGEETNTLNDFTADGLDLHQGYVDFRSANKESVTLVRIGSRLVTITIV